MKAMDIPRVATKKRSAWWSLGGIAIAVVTLTAALSQLKVAAPKVERASLWLGTVKQGEMVREVRGAGSLVPEEIRWLTTVVPARVERILLRPGANVSADSVILELSNPDLKLTALEAEQQLASAKAELTRLDAEQNSQTLAQRSTLATLQAEQKDADRRATADQALADKGFLSSLELHQSKGKSDELKGRVQFESERLIALDRGKAAQLSAQRAQVERMAAIANLRRDQVNQLRVTALVDGVVQEVGVQLGQWVVPGTVLAKVARPTRLKAEVKIAELSAKDIAIGQRALIDTRNGIVEGHVSRVDPAVTAGTVKVDVALDGTLPAGARADQSIEGAIELERLPNVVYVDRPANAQVPGTVALFRLDGDGDRLARANVQLGRASAKTVEVLAGLKPGDQVILSDMSNWAQHDALKLK